MNYFRLYISTEALQRFAEQFIVQKDTYVYSLHPLRMFNRYSMEIFEGLNFETIPRR